MDDSKALGILRTIAPEFKAVSDDEAQQFLVLSAPLVSRKKFGELYDQAVALLAAHRIHRRTADFHFLTFDGRTAVDRIAESVEETSGKLVAHFNGRSLAQKHHLCIGGDTFSTLENLQSHIVTGNLHHLGQLAVYGCQLIIPYPRSFQRARGFRNLSNLSIYFLKCFCCHLIIYALRSSINSCNCL